MSALDRAAYTFMGTLFLWAVMAFILIAHYRSAAMLDCDRYTTPQDSTCVVSQTP